METNQEWWTSVKGRFRFNVTPHSKVDLPVETARPSLFRDPATRLVLKAIGTQLRSRGYGISELKGGKGCSVLDLNLSRFKLSLMLRRADLQPGHAKFLLWTLPRSRLFRKRPLAPSDLEDWRHVCDALEQILSRDLGVEGLQRLTQAEATKRVATH